MSEQKKFRSGFVALIGRPNSGKSTLMNTVLGSQLSIVTPLPQTTRKNLRGIFTDDIRQLIFVDTPGIHKGKHAFNTAMIREAQGVLSDGGIDLVCYLVDLARDFGEEESVVAAIAGGTRIPVLILFNKIDSCENPDTRIEEFFTLYPTLKNSPNVRISARKAETRDIFLNAVDPFIHEGPHYFDDDSLTDASTRFFAAEYIRKHIILNTRDEVPHATFVEIESYRETPDKHYVDATIHVETTGQRGIIVGKGGSIINRIRNGAQHDLQKLVGKPVQVTCHIKVTPRWRDNDQFLRSMGLSPA